MPKADYLISNATIVNEGKHFKGYVYIKGERILKISTEKQEDLEASTVIDGTGKLLMPGVIDDQVHFREPGLTQKAEIYTESKAAVAGGITSFMEMPNTVPNTLTQELLEDKYQVGAERSLANYSFYMGASNDNLKEVLKTDPAKVCGVKIFMGSSTGNMLVDSETALEGIFKECPMLIAVHCEDEETIRSNTKKYKKKYGKNIPFSAHPEIRSAEACYRSSSKAVGLAEKFGARLHILHISTEKELELFRNDIPLEQKHITAEACIHHLWFTDADYEQKGAFIKWNPAVKTAQDRAAVRQAVKDNKIDVIATDHAPHTLKEKSLDYLRAPSGGPLVQHALVAMLELVNLGVFTWELMVEKMCHAPADMFAIKERGYIRQGYYADLVLVDLEKDWTVSKDNIHYKCGWSPFEGETFHSAVETTFINGNKVYDNGQFFEAHRGKRLLFHH